MAHRLVNLQAQLRAVKDDVKYPLRPLVGFQQRHRLFAHAPRILQQLQFVDQFVSLVLPLPSEGVGIRPFLDLAPRKRMRRVADAGRVFGLMNVGAFRRVKPLLLAPEIHVGLRQSHAGHRAQLRVDLHQQLEILLNRNGEGINLDRGRPIRGCRLLRSQPDVALLDARRSPGNFDRPRRRGFDRGSAQIVGRRISPRPVGDDAHPNAERLRIGSAADLSVFGRQRPAAVVANARVCIRRPTYFGDIQGPVGDVFHGGKV